jgi:hypothetical protein
VVRSRSYRVIYYFDTPALERRHQLFGRVTNQAQEPKKYINKKKHQTHTVIFEKIQKPFYFKKINIKTFTKHLINSNKQLKLKLNKENQHFMH